MSDSLSFFVFVFFFQIIETGSKGHLKFRLSHHLFLLLMDFLIRVFTSEYLGVVRMLGNNSLALSRT